MTEQLVQPNGWQGLNDVMGLLPGPTIGSSPYNILSSGRRNSITSEDFNSEPPKLVHHLKINSEMCEGQPLFNCQLSKGVHELHISNSEKEEDNENYDDNLEK